MKPTTENAHITRGTVVPPTPDDDEPDEIRGMMPSFHVWDDAQHALAPDRAAARRRRDLRARARAAHEAIFRRRWLRVVVVVAVIAVTVLFERRGHKTNPVTASTASEELVWRDVASPSGTFHASFPAKPTATIVESVGVSGEQLEARVQQTTVAIRAFQLSGPNEARALVEPMIDERAYLLNGFVDGVQPVGSRVGEAYEGLVQTTVTIAIVRVILDGPTLFVMEIRGDVGSQRSRQIYDRMLLNFTATTGH